MRSDAGRSTMRPDQRAATSDDSLRVIPGDLFVTSPAVDRRLLDAVVAVADGLELEPTLRRIVRTASDLTSAPFAALGVLDEDGLHKSFIHTGMDEDLVRMVGGLPRGHG